MNTANFLSIPAMMFADQEILVYGKHRRSYGELLSRVRRLAASGPLRLTVGGVERGGQPHGVQEHFGFSSSHHDPDFGASRGGTVAPPDGSLQAVVQRGARGADRGCRNRPG